MQLEINGKAYEVGSDDTRYLLWVLRDKLGLIGTKYGCGMGMCGSCTVLIDGKPTRSCTTSIGRLSGKSITTIEGLAKETLDGELLLHPVQRAFVETQTPQCGWCMSGQMMTAAALLVENPSPTVEEINKAMNGVYCRCGTYVRIRQAVQQASEIIALEGWS